MHRLLLLLVAFCVAASAQHTIVHPLGGSSGGGGGSGDMSMSVENDTAGEIPVAVGTSGKNFEPSGCTIVSGVLSCGSGDGLIELNLYGSAPDAPASGFGRFYGLEDGSGFYYRLNGGSGIKLIDTTDEVIVELEVFGPTTDTATGDGAKYFVVPSTLNGYTLTSVSGHVVSAGTTGTLDVDLARCAAVASGSTCSGTVADMLSTNLTIDSGESKSSTAAAAVAINASNDDVATDQVIRVDVDAVHSGTAAKGLVLVLGWTL